MNSFWEHAHWERRSGKESIDERCALEYAERCDEPATYNKVYETKILWWTIKDMVPYCSKHALREQVKDISDKLSKGRT